jgi:membrane protein YqaA with SNARE-associated domain
VDLSILFSAAFLSATLLPGGSELVLLDMLREGAQRPAVLWAVASAGNTLGGMSGWLFGRWSARLACDRHRTAGTGDRRARMWLRRWGGAALLFSWVPVVGDPLCVAAGWLRIGFLATFVFVTTGKAMRYGVLVVAATWPP